MNWSLTNGHDPSTYLLSKLMQDGLLTRQVVALIKKKWTRAETCHPFNSDTVMLINLISIFISVIILAPLEILQHAAYYFPLRFLCEEDVPILLFTCTLYDKPEHFNFIIKFAYKPSHFLNQIEFPHHPIHRLFSSHFESDLARIKKGAFSYPIHGISKPNYDFHCRFYLFLHNSLDPYLDIQCCLSTLTLIHAMRTCHRELADLILLIGHIQKQGPNYPLPSKLLNRAPAIYYFLHCSDFNCVMTFYKRFIPHAYCTLSRNFITEILRFWPGIGNNQNQVKTLKFILAGCYIRRYPNSLQNLCVSAISHKVFECLPPFPKTLSARMPPSEILDFRKFLFQAGISTLPLPMPLIQYLMTYHPYIMHSRFPKSIVCELQKRLSWQ